MLKAYDTITKCMVSAEDVARNNIDEPFRYECLCCGEEVHIAAAKSRKISPHFRHLRGNSDTDCELYLGRLLQSENDITAAIRAAQERMHPRAEILFDIEKQIFYFSVSFTKEMIQQYEDEKYKLIIKQNQGNKELESIYINRTNFAPDSPVLFPLNLSINSCIITIVNGQNTKNITSYYQILKGIEFPTFFKLQTSVGNEHIGKRHTDGIIYTETKYYIIATEKSYIEKLQNFKPCRTFMWNLRINIDESVIIMIDT